MMCVFLVGSEYGVSIVTQAYFQRIWVKYTISFSVLITLSFPNPCNEKYFIYVPYDECTPIDCTPVDFIILGLVSFENIPMY